MVWLEILISEEEIQEGLEMKILIQNLSVNQKKLSNLLALKIAKGFKWNTGMVLVEV